MAARLGRMAVNNTAFFVCDMQEKFRPSIRYFPEIIKVAQRMVSETIAEKLRSFNLDLFYYLYKRYSSSIVRI